MIQTLNSNTNSTKSIKFLYSYGGKISPRPIEGSLRYVGGHTRVLCVDRSISFSELMVEFWESCESSMSLKCKLPSEDLDVLISIKSDEDLKNVIEEYDRASPETKIRAVLVPIKSVKKVSAPSSRVSSFYFPAALEPRRFRVPAGPFYYTAAQPALAAAYRCCFPALGTWILYCEQHGAVHSRSVGCHMIQRWCCTQHGAVHSTGSISVGARQYLHDETLWNFHHCS